MKAARRLPILATPRERLTSVSRLAPRTSYGTPEEAMLSEAWRAGRRGLDEFTRSCCGPVSAANSSAPPAELREGTDVAYIPPNSPLPLVSEISYRFVEGNHLWIAVQEGSCVVLTESEDEAFRVLQEGHTLIASVALLQGKRQLERAPAWELIGATVSKIAAAGFVRGIEGRRDEGVVDPSRFMRVHLTQKCNLACGHCYSDSSPFVDTTDQLDVETWERVIADFAEYGGKRILFTGGEALTHPGCDHLLRHAKRHALHVTLFSNGLLVGQHLDVIAETCDMVQISIDGADEAANDSIRGRGTFERASRAVELLLSRSVPVRVSVVVVQSNFESIQDHFEEFAADWTARGVRFRLGNGLTRHGRGEEFSNELAHRAARGVINELERRYSEHAEPGLFRKCEGCGYGEQIVVAQNGTVHPCHLLDGPITHVSAQPFSELLQVLAAESKDYAVDEVVGCRGCDIRYLCGGECRVMNGKQTGNRRVTSCQAEDKLARLIGLVEAYQRLSSRPAPES